MFLPKTPWQNRCGQTSWGGLSAGEFPEAWDLPSLQTKANGASDHMEILGIAIRKSWPRPAGQPDPACDVAPDDLFDEGFQVWAAGEDDDDFGGGILDHPHHLLDLLLIRVLGDELAEVDTDVLSSASSLNFSIPGRP